MSTCFVNNSDGICNPLEPETGTLVNNSPNGHRFPLIVIRRELCGKAALLFNVGQNAPNVAYCVSWSLSFAWKVCAAPWPISFRFFDSNVGFQQALRQQRVIITGSSYPTPAPDKIPGLMSSFVRWLSRNEKRLHPVEFAALAHQRFVFIHPFIDGNGRVSRLLMILCLIRQGYTIGIIPTILRGEYIALLEKAHRDALPFVKFIAERVEETQKDLLRMLE